MSTIALRLVAAGDGPGPGTRRPADRSPGTGRWRSSTNTASGGRPARDPALLRHRTVMTDGVLVAAWPRISRARPTRCRVGADLPHRAATVPPGSAAAWESGTCAVANHGSIAGRGSRDAPGGGGRWTDSAIGARPAPLSGDIGDVPADVAHHVAHQARRTTDLLPAVVRHAGPPFGPTTRSTPRRPPAQPPPRTEPPS
jgi:hypothetical protein